MQISILSKENTLTFKGIGIILIVLSNFFHWMPPWTLNIEWDFAPQRLSYVYQGLQKYPFESINILLSNFGHYGVQIFLLISGMGLAISMQKRSMKWGTFMVGRLQKLYPLLITGFVFLFFYEIILSKRIIGWYFFREFIYKLLFLHTFNITDGSAQSLSGPLWFFGLIFQLYVLFLLLYKMIRRYNLKAFIVICIISYVWIYISQYLYQPKANIMLFQNAPGHLPEFSLGILLALNAKKNIPPAWIVLSAVVFVLGNFFKPFFPFTFLSITLLLYWGFVSILPVLNKTTYMKSAFVFWGTVSMILFVIHGPLRSPFVTISGETFYGKLAGAALFLIAVSALSILGKILYDGMVNKIQKAIPLFNQV